MNRRAFLGAAASAGLARGTRRPNVLVFMTDQETALLPGPARLPHRGRILSRGANFTHAYCNTPQCSPARVSLITGLEPHRAGVMTNIDGNSLGKALRPDTPAIGDVFTRAGYSTGYFGKWHLGPEKGGFRHFHSGENDPETVRAAAEWMRSRKSDEPWLCWVSVFDPHHVYDIPRGRAPKSVEIRPGVRPPRSGLENLTGKPAEQREFIDKDQGRATCEFTTDDWLRYRSYYLGLVEKTDALLGTVLDAAGDLDQTVVAYTTDHGDQMGEHGLPYKGPFMYDELLRIPFTIAGPGMKRGNRSDFARQTDLAPTLASLAGAEWPGPVDGRDLAMGGPSPDRVLLEYFSKQKWVNPIRTIRTREWKYSYYDHSGHEELYDLRGDPHEMRNLARSGPHADRQRKLRDQLDGWFTRPASIRGA